MNPTPFKMSVMRALYQYEAQAVLFAQMDWKLRIGDSKITVEDQWF